MASLRILVTLERICSRTTYVPSAAPFGPSPSACSSEKDIPAARYLLLGSAPRTIAGGDPDAGSSVDISALSSLAARVAKNKRWLAWAASVPATPRFCPLPGAYAGELAEGKQTSPAFA